MSRGKRNRIEEEFRKARGVRVNVIGREADMEAKA